MADTTPTNALFWKRNCETFEQIAKTQKARAEKAEYQVKLWQDRMWATVPERAVWRHGNGEHAGPLPFEHCPECRRIDAEAKLDWMTENRDEWKHALLLVTGIKAVIDGEQEGSE